jgi:hypothetical protein
VTPRAHTTGVQSHPAPKYISISVPLLKVDSWTTPDSAVSDRTYKALSAVASNDPVAAIFHTQALLHELPDREQQLSVLCKLHVHATKKLEAHRRNTRPRSRVLEALAGLATAGSALCLGWTAATFYFDGYIFLGAVTTLGSLMACFVSSAFLIGDSKKDARHDLQTSEAIEHHLRQMIKQIAGPSTHKTMSEGTSHAVAHALSVHSVSAVPSTPSTTSTSPASVTPVTSSFTQASGC